MEHLLTLKKHLIGRLKKRHQRGGLWLDKQLYWKTGVRLPDGHTGIHFFNYFWSLHDCKGLISSTNCQFLFCIAICEVGCKINQHKAVKAARTSDTWSVFPANASSRCRPAGRFQAASPNCSRWVHTAQAENWSRKFGPITHPDGQKKTKNSAPALSWKKWEQRMLGTYSQLRPIWGIRVVDVPDWTPWWRFEEASSSHCATGAS